MKKYLILLLLSLLVSCSIKKNETSFNKVDTSELENKISEINLKEVQDNLYFQKEISTENTNYDAIIVNQGSCFGECPINSNFLNRNGEFYFRSTEYNTVETGFYTSLIDKNETLKIFNLFDKLNFNALKDKYTTYQEDVSTDFITFIKDGNIVKTIESEMSCPIDLRQAYSELSDLYEKSKLKKKKDSNFIGSIMHCTFNDTIFLENSEVFYLEVLLEKGNKGNFEFVKKYNVDFFIWGENNVDSIVSDGRYYRINYKDNMTKTIDIGFNFIENNPILKQKRIE